jgi:hypothetical protein
MPSAVSSSEGLVLLAQVRMGARPVGQVPAAGSQRQSRIGGHSGSDVEGCGVVLGDHVDIIGLHGDLARTKGEFVVDTV